MKKHNFYLVPKEKIIMGGPMNVFVRCKNKGCIAGAELSFGDEQEFLKQVIKNSKDNCPFTVKDFFKPTPKPKVSNSIPLKGK